MHLAAAQREVEPVHGADAAEAQHEALEQQVAPGVLGRQQHGQRGEVRLDRAVLRQRPAVAEVEQRSDAAGHGQHDHQQQRRVEEGRPGRQRCRDLRQQRQQDRAEHRAEDRAAPADQDRDEEEQREVEGEGVRRDVGLQAREEPTRDRGRGAGEEEDDHQQARLGDAAGFRGHLGVADGDERAAEAAGGDVAAHPGPERGEAEAEQVEAPGGVQRRGKFRPRKADAAAGDALPGQRDLRDDGGEAERRHGEVEGAQPQRRQPHHHAEHRADHGRDAERREGRHRLRDIARGQHARGVGAEREQRDIADGELPGEADDEVQARHQHPVDSRARADQRPVFVAGASGSSRQRTRMPRKGAGSVSIRPSAPWRSRRGPAVRPAAR
jgi:hypothetical protein